MANRTLPGLALAAAGGSHLGRQRTTNEDRFHADAERGIFLVIDGVGGHAAGEHAAETALTVLRARLERATGTPAERIREAITLANNEILRLGRARADWAGMGCVLTVAVVEDGVVTIGHVGDTRLYHFRNGDARKLTHDHSPVGERGEADGFPGRGRVGGRGAGRGLFLLLLLGGGGGHRGEGVFLVFVNSLLLLHGDRRRRRHGRFPHGRRRGRQARPARGGDQRGLQLAQHGTGAARHRRHG